MSKITIDRSVVEQALEALFMYKPMVTGVTFQHGLDAMQALSAALEQPQDHFFNAGNRVPTGWKLVPVEPTKDMKAAGAFAAMDQVRRSYNPPSAYIPVDSMALLSYRAMIAAAPQPQVEQEPAIYPEEAFDMGLEAIPYYTHPQPPRQPLTKEEIAVIAAACGGLASDFVVSIASAIEVAHGIGGEK